MTQIFVFLVKFVYKGLDMPELVISTLPPLEIVIQGQRLPGLETNSKTEKVRKQRTKNLPLLITKLKLGT